MAEVKKNTKKKKKVDEGPKYLTPEEIHKFELANLNRELRNTSFEALTIKSQLIEANTNILKEKIKVQEGLKVKLEFEMLKLKDVMNEEARVQRNWVDDLKKSYGIKPKKPFGHNPFTGEVMGS